MGSDFDDMVETELENLRRCAADLADRSGHTEAARMILAGEADDAPEMRAMRVWEAQK